jgi:hypothetical protein
MGDDLGQFGLTQAVIHPPVQVKRQLLGLAAGDQRGNRHQAAVAWGEAVRRHRSAKSTSLV